LHLLLERHDHTDFLCKIARQRKKVASKRR
jgi:hypothetical protein